MLDPEIVPGVTCTGGDKAFLGLYDGVNEFFYDSLPCYGTCFIIFRWAPPKKK